MVISINRRELVGGIAAIASAPTATQAEVRAFGVAWFNTTAGVERTWTFALDSADHDHVMIRPLGFDAQDGPRVTVLYPRASSAYDIAISRILNVFDDKGIRARFDVINYSGDAARARRAVVAAENNNNALIFAMGSEAAAWLWNNYRGGALPVVTVCSKDPVTLGQLPSYDRGSGSNFAFTSLNMPVEAQMAYVEQLKPKLRNLGVLVDLTNVSAVETQAKPAAQYFNPRGVRVLQLAVQNPANVRAELAQLVRSAVLSMEKTDPGLENSAFWVTGSTSIFTEMAVINSESRQVPVLSVVPEVVKEGDDSAVLSIGISFESNAHLAAVYASKILAGEAAGILPVGLVSPPDIAINFRKVRQIGMKVPFKMFEIASTIFDYDGKPVRLNGVNLGKTQKTI